MRACKYKQKYSQYLIFNAPIYYVTTNKHHQNCQLSSQSAVNFNYYFPTKYPQMLLHFATTKPCPACILCRKNTSFSAQLTNKRLSSSRNSIPFPPPSLSITAFVALHSTTHAITSIRGHVRTDFRSLPCRITTLSQNPNFG